MKKIVTIIAACLISVVSYAANKVVNVYNWSGYIPYNVLKTFEKETGIKVNYSTFDSNLVLYTKLKANADSDYDIIVPSSYVIQRMKKENMLHKLDKTKIPNVKYLNPMLMNRAYDSRNQYSLPYLWGTSGIVVTKEYCAKFKITSWASLWNHGLLRQIALLNDMRDVFAMAIKVSGYSINDENPEHIKKAYLKLKELMPNIQSFNDDARQFYINKDSSIGMSYSGDANMVIKEMPNFVYIYPKEGAIVWIDNIAISAKAKHLENAYKFINFILRPDIAKKISLGVGYSSPNIAAVKLMSKEDRDNRVLNPTDTELKNSEIEEEVSQKTTELYLKYWELLKLET